MTWRTRVLVDNPPALVVIYTGWNGPENRYIATVLCDGDAPRVDFGASAAEADAAALAWLQASTTVVQIGHRETSMIRCGRSRHGAIVLYHLRETLVVPPQQVAALAAASPSNGQAVANILQGTLNERYQERLSAWVNDTTIGWNAIPHDLGVLQAQSGWYEPVCW